MQRSFFFSSRKFRSEIKKVTRLSQRPYFAASIKARLLVYARVNGLLTRPAAQTKFRRFFGVRRLQHNFVLQVDGHVIYVQLPSTWRDWDTQWLTQSRYVGGNNSRYFVPPEWVRRMSEYPVYQTRSKLNALILRGGERGRERKTMWVFVM